MARTLMAPVSGKSELWEDWESWFRNLAETHALAPILAFVPTVYRGQTWLAAAAVALDWFRSICLPSRREGCRRRLCAIAPASTPCARLQPSWPIAWPPRQRR